MNQQTPMQMMIQNIINIESKTYNQEQLYMLSALKIGALLLLEKEKEHICNAYVEGLEGLYIGAGEYYNKTFKTK